MSISQTEEQVPNINPNRLFVEMNELILKFVWKCEGSRRVKTNLRENEVSGLIQLDIKNYYRVKETDGVAVQKDRHTDQKRRETEGTEIDLNIKGQLICDKGDKTI